MKKKIIALIMVIPLVLMLTIFAISKTVAISVDVPAESIKITSQNDDGFVSFDMATYQNDYFVLAKVFPDQAKNQNYTVSVNSLDDNAEPCVSVDENNLMHLHREGLAEVIAKSNDKGFEDIIKVSVTSSKPYDMDLSVTNGELKASSDANFDYEYNAYTGSRVEFKSSISPNNVDNNVTTWISNDKCFVINPYSGIAVSTFSGEYIVTAMVNDGVEGPIVKRIKVVLQKPNKSTTINGSTSPMIRVEEGSTEVGFFVETDKTLFDTDIVCSRKQAVSIEELKPNCYYVKITLDKGIVIDEKIPVSVHGVNFEFESTDCVINVTTSYDKNAGERTILQKNGANVVYNLITEPFVEANYKWSCDNDILTINQLGVVNKSANIVANRPGVCKLTVVVTTKLKQYTKVYTIKVVDKVVNPNFASKNDYGIKKIYTYGDIELKNGVYSRVTNKLSIIDGYGTALPSDLFDFVSSDEHVAKVNNNGEIVIVNDGVASIVAKWKHNDYFNEKISAKTTISVVKNGVYVTDSDSLYKASEDAKKIVLKNSINFAEGWSEDKIVNLLQKHKMPTTFDWQYYINCGLSRPNVSYILEFKNDLYGNGYVINAEAITNAKDGSNPKYFRGPLDFVAVDNRAAVKGQDNICFLVRKNNVKIDNICLESIRDSKLIEQNEGNHTLNLNNLNYAGTTLEIMADSVRLVNSRVRNGRTTVRIYSGNDSNNVITNYPLNANQVSKEKINVVIESCILSHAREFILKIGSNRGIRCRSYANEPYVQEYLKDKTGKAFDCINKLYDIDNSNFNDNYILTDVTVKNSILDTSGLFAVGMETHFAGPFLLGTDKDFGEMLKQYHWEKLAATSYGAVLHLEDEVKIYDWKDVGNVDSSTLIESNKNTVGNGSLANIISLDIGKMITSATTLPEYCNIISNVNNKKYVHGGIAFYGGGRNYSKIDMTKFSSEKLNKYDVNINILAKTSESNSPEYMQGTMLPLAAGSEDFTFFMYDNNSEFSYTKQQASLNDGSAFGWLKGVLR